MSFCSYKLNPASSYTLWATPFFDARTATMPAMMLTITITATARQITTMTLACLATEGFLSTAVVTGLFASHTCTITGITFQFT